MANNDGWTPLNVASTNGRTEVVKILLKASSANIVGIDNLGRTALFLASRYGRLHVVQYLLSAGCFDPDTKNHYGSTALSAAVVNGHREIVELLITAGAGVQQQAHAGHSLLWWASRLGRCEMTSLLLRHMESTEALAEIKELPADVKSFISIECNV